MNPPRSHVAGTQGFGSKWRGPVGRKTLSTIALLLLVCGIFYVIRRPTEPLVRDEQVTMLLNAYAHEILPSQETDQTIRAIGTNAIPTLLKMLRTHDSRFKLKWIQFARRHDLARFDSFVSAYDQNIRAAKAFRALGPLAEKAVPDLIKILQEQISDSSQFSTAESLGNLGPAARSAVPSLIAALTAKSISIRAEACRALGRIGVDAELVVPLLEKALRDPAIAVRRSAAASLGDFGSDSASAVPLLTAALEDPDKGVRNCARKALDGITAGLKNQKTPK